jgi:hypothetical protein
MKKTYPFLLCLLAGSLASAQIKYGPRLGINLNSASLSTPGGGENTRTSSNATSLTSFCIGGLGELRLGENFALQLSLLASRKGYNFVEVIETQNKAALTTASADFLKSSVITNRGVHQLLYLDVPLTLVYKKDLGIGKIMFGLGGYYAYCLWGVSKEQNTYVVGSASDLSLSSIDGTYDLIKKKQLSRNDFGAVLMTGLEFNERTQLTAQYSLGLADVNPSDATVRNRTVSITVTYLFGDN